MIRIGVDFGGTKIEAAALDRGGAVLARERAPNPGLTFFVPVSDALLFLGVDLR
jgi:predicted NBD/HSP70 family sugar kinase